MSFKVTKTTIKRVSEEIHKFIEVGDWKPASPYHLIALVAFCHESVYGIADSELQNPQRFGLAGHVCKTFVEREFNNDITQAVVFIKWSWDRERKRESWRVQNGKAGFRLGWRLQFSDSLLTDYRLDQRRRGSVLRG